MAKNVVAYETELTQLAVAFIGKKAVLNGEPNVSISQEQQPLAERKRICNSGIAALLIVAVIFIITGVYSGKRNKSNAEMEVSTHPRKEQLMVACNFLNYTSVTECQRSTSFHTHFVVGNTIPTEIGLLTQLTSLNLFSKHLIGTIPSTLGNLIQLTFLGLENNHLHGTIPSTFGKLVKLNHLYLQQNTLTGSIPSTLENLKQLNHLSLYRNQLTGTFSSALGNLMLLKNLYLYSNQLNGILPPSLCSISGIEIRIDCHYTVCSCCIDGHSLAPCA
jgi:hypothetical protein